MNTVMFDAFNAHDIDGVMALFSEHLAFYHDKGGLLRYEDERNGLKANCDQNNGLRRELLAGSLEVYPITNYGAVRLRGRSPAA